MVEAGFVMLAVTVLCIALFTGLAMWLVPKTLEEHEEESDHGDDASPDGGVAGQLP